MTDPTRRTMIEAALGSALLMPAGCARFGMDSAPASVRVGPPAFPDRHFRLTDFGDPGRGETLATSVFDRAIRACAAAGGGRVVVPPGRYLTGPIRLRSNVDLHVGEGATILFSTDPDDYPLVHTRWQGIDLMNYSPLVYAYDEENVAITGGGTLDGQADARHWWPWRGPWKGAIDHGWRPGMPDSSAASDRLEAMGARGTPLGERIFGNGSYLRPSMIQPFACRNVLIEGVRLRRAPFWQVHPVLCRNVIVRGLDIVGLGPNTDGCDPESCSGVLIEQCRFDTGDDAIAIKSGRGPEAHRQARPCEAIVIRHCTMARGHAGIAIGSEISGGVRDLVAHHCTVDSDGMMYAIRIKNNAARGGVLEHLRFRDIRVGRIGLGVIACDFTYEEGANGPYTPVLRDVVFDRFDVRHGVRVLDAKGLPNAPIEQLAIRDSRFDGITEPSIVRFVEGLTLDHVRVDGRPVEHL